MSDIENEKELREIMRELNATNLEEKKGIRLHEPPRWAKKWMANSKMHLK